MTSDMMNTCTENIWQIDEWFDEWMNDGMINDLMVECMMVWWYDKWFDGWMNDQR